MAKHLNYTAHLCCKSAWHCQFAETNSEQSNSNDLILISAWMDTTWEPHMQHLEFLNGRKQDRHLPNKISKHHNLVNFVNTDF